MEEGHKKNPSSIIIQYLSREREATRHIKQDRAKSTEEDRTRTENNWVVKKNGHHFNNGECNSHRTMAIRFLEHNL